MIRTEKRMRICTALLLCNLAFIWGNSLLPGEVSGRISDWVKDLLSLLFSQTGEEDNQGGFLLRKLAHFTEFAALGVLLSWLYGMLRKKPFYPALCGIAAACIDETIQMFVPNRGPAIRDVCIDSCGVLAGMILMYLGHTWIRRKTQRKLSEERNQ